MLQKYQGYRLWWNIVCFINLSISCYSIKSRFEYIRYLCDKAQYTALIKCYKAYCVTNILHMKYLALEMNPVNGNRECITFGSPSK